MRTTEAQEHIKSSPGKPSLVFPDWGKGAAPSNGTYTEVGTLHCDTMAIPTCHLITWVCTKAPKSRKLLTASGISGRPGL